MQISEILLFRFCKKRLPYLIITSSCYAFLYVLIFTEVLHPSAFLFIFSIIIGMPYVAITSSLARMADAGISGGWIALLFAGPLGAVLQIALIILPTKTPD